jgi:hypothetical protein
MSRPYDHRLPQPERGRRLAVAGRNMHPQLKSVPDLGHPAAQSAQDNSALMEE